MVPVAVQSPVLLTTDPRAAQAALEEAQRLDRRNDPAAVDYFFQAAALAAQGITPTGPANQSESIYRQALWGLVDSGQRLGRLDPRTGLSVVHGGQRTVPIRYFGFAWRPSDFSQLSAADVPTGEIAHRYVRPGLGIPLLGARVAPCEEPFFAPWQPFAVTALLRPVGDVVDPTLSGSHVLELYNPLAFDCVGWRGGSRPLASDVTAPLAAIVDEAPRQYLRGFTAPSDVSVRPKLTMLEPYQPGKIPVVFIHGLYSDPITWADMINELRAQRDLYDQYQFWAYRYPTGGDLLSSTAALRRELRLARATCDPHGGDPAFDQMVLVGHSLGGLVAKTQVTSSHEILWRAAAVQPFDALRAPPELEEQLARGFFFDPVCSVKRVIFIGTPHRGSGMASRAAGRLGSLLVNFSTEQDAQYQTLIEQNRDVFKLRLQGRRPTTIALLEPDNPFLDALQRMPINCQVRLHSIIGTGGLNPTDGPSDGVVPVASAEHAGDSALEVPERHERLHRHPASIAEVSRILRLHAAEAR
jgi:pimeloyl-ACP methyl ester carboxylesterase